MFKPTLLSGVILMVACSKPSAQGPAIRNFPGRAPATELVTGSYYVTAPESGACWTLREEELGQLTARVQLETPCHNGKRQLFRVGRSEGWYTIWTQFETNAAVKSMGWPAKDLLASSGSDAVEGAAPSSRWLLEVSGRGGGNVAAAIRSGIDYLQEGEWKSTCVERSADGKVTSAVCNGGNAQKWVLKPAN